jgi:ribosomal protein S18 acetylase RimI-like enzyme
MRPRILKQAEQWPFRVAADDWDEAAFWEKHQKTMKLLQDKANGLKFVTPQPGVTMAVGPNWSGSVPSGHPDYIPRQAEADDIHGYLNHDEDGHVNFIHTHPMVRRMGVGTKLLDHAGISDTAHSYNFTSDGKKFFKSLGRA